MVQNKTNLNKTESRNLKVVFINSWKRYTQSVTIVRVPLLVFSVTGVREYLEGKVSPFRPLFDYSVIHSFY